MTNKLWTFKYKLCLPLATLALFFYTITATAQTGQNSGFELNLLAGVANLNTGLGSVVFPPVPGGLQEKDTLAGATNSAAFAPGIGVAYNFVLPVNPITGQSYVLHAIVIGINAYELNGSRNGPVYLYGLQGAGDFLNYNANVSSWRVMLDSEWDFYPLWQRVMPFLEGGIGDAINTVNLKYSPQPGVQIVGNPLSLPHSTSNNFAYDLGLGVKIDMTTHTQLSLRYLYSDLGDPSTSSANLAQPFVVDLHASSVLLGFTYLFGN